MLVSNPFFLSGRESPYLQLSDSSRVGEGVFLSRFVVRRNLKGGGTRMEFTCVHFVSDLGFYRRVLSR